MVTVIKKGMILKLLICMYVLHLECQAGHFGIECRERCSGHCIDNEPCGHVSGECPSGCQDGYIGTDCANSKTTFWTILFLKNAASIRELKLQRPLPNFYLRWFIFM